MSDREPIPVTGERDTHRFDPEDHEHLSDPQRLEDIRYRAFLDRMRIEPGSRVLDFGTGNGAVLPELSGRVGGEGRVYGMDVSPQMLKLARDRLVDRPLENVSLVRNEETVIPLPDDWIDRSLLIFVLHEVAHPTATLEELHRVTADGGWVGVIDWKLVEDPEEGPPPEHRIGPEEALERFNGAGFTLESEEDWTESLYLLIVKK